MSNLKPAIFAISSPGFVGFLFTRLIVFILIDILVPDCINTLWDQNHLV